jgi:hypothetical protein
MAVSQKEGNNNKKFSLFDKMRQLVGEIGLGY